MLNFFVTVYWRFREFFSRNRTFDGWSEGGGQMSTTWMKEHIRHSDW